MKRWVILCLVFVGQLAVAQTTVMTYNIRNSRANGGENNWKNRWERLVELIKKVSPDVLGTQEVLKDQLIHLKNALIGYNCFGGGRNNGKHAGEQSAVYYRNDLAGGNFWLSETPQTPGSKSWDAVITRVCTWVKLKDKQTGKPFFVFNTHFDHKGKQARRKSAELLMYMVDSLAGDLPVIVMGDFNFTPVRLLTPH